MIPDKVTPSLRRKVTRPLERRERKSYKNMAVQKQPAFVITLDFR
jgi:hypothetical protein